MAKSHEFTLIEPGPGEDFLDYITGLEWRRRVTAALLMGKTSFEGECKYVVRSGSEKRTLLLRWFFNGDPDVAAQKYLDENNSSVPSIIVRAMVEKHKTKKGGRHARREEWARQKASDMACFLAVQHLLEKGIKPTPAGEQVGRLMHLSRQAVLGAWKRLESPSKSKITMA